MREGGVVRLVCAEPSPTPSDPPPPPLPPPKARDSRGNGRSELGVRGTGVLAGMETQGPQAGFMLRLPGSSALCAPAPPASLSPPALLATLSSATSDSASFHCHLISERATLLFIFSEPGSLSSDNIIM